MKQSKILAKSVPVPQSPPVVKITKTSYTPHGSPDSFRSARSPSPVSGGKMKKHKK